MLLHFTQQIKYMPLDRKMHNLLFQQIRIKRDISNKYFCLRPKAKSRPSNYLLEMLDFSFFFTIYRCLSMDQPIYPYLLVHPYAADQGADVRGIIGLVSTYVIYCRFSAHRRRTWLLFE